MANTEERRIAKRMTSRRKLREKDKGLVLGLREEQRRTTRGT